jgi:hypothetical protein
MQHAIPYGQMLDDLFTPALLLLGGIWCIYFWPRSLRRQIDRGEIDAFHGLARLKKAPLFGYFAILLAIVTLVGTLERLGLFHHSVWGAAIFCALALGVLVWWQIQKRRIQ